MTLPFDLTSQEFFRNPAPTVSRLRAAGPVVEVRLPFIGRVWMTTTQEMASRVLKDGKLFTMRKDDGALAVLVLTAAAALAASSPASAWRRSALPAPAPAA